MAYTYGMADTATDWIAPGAPVVIYWDTRDDKHPTFHVTTIKRIAGQSFTVEQVDERFKLDTLATKRVTHGWSSAC